MKETVTLCQKCYITIYQKCYISLQSKYAVQSPINQLVLYLYLYVLGYNHVVAIPKGAFNIRILQQSRTGSEEDDNYLGKSL